MVGPAFERDALGVLSERVSQLCPWAAELSALLARDDVVWPPSDDGARVVSRRQMDLFCYCTGDTLAPCDELPEAGARLVLDGAALVPPLAAAAVGAGTGFSPFDKSRTGPHKYFVGEVYSGHDAARREGKVRQLETELEFLCGRFSDRTGIPITDVTQLIGAAALVFPADHVAGSLPRREQFPAALESVRAAAGPLLQRLSRAGRLLLVLLTPQQAPASFVARETAIELQKLREGQRELLLHVRALRGAALPGHVP